MNAMDSANGDRRPLIAHVIYRLSVGGMENGLVNLINELPQDRFRHAIICLTYSTEFESRIKVGNVRIYELHKRPGKDPSAYLRFWRLIRRLRPVIVHTRNIGTLDLAPLAAFAGVPVRVHGEHGWAASDLHGASQKCRLMRRICDPAIDCYVAVSKNIANWLQDVIGVPGDKVHQIYNGVDTDIFQPEGKVGSLPFPESRNDLKVIGTVGRMDPIKGLDVLLAAFRNIIDSRPAIRSILRLVIVGDGTIFESINERIQQNGLRRYVWLAGARNDIPDILRNLDIFILASMNEGTSNTILEAMATELPVIATRVGGNCELLAAGDTGELVAVNSPAEIAQCILHYIDEPSLRHRHGVAARRRVIQEFSLQAMVLEYAHLYEQHIDACSSKESV